MLHYLEHSTTVPNSGSSTVHPISQYVSYYKFSKSHCAFLAAITYRDEPNSYSHVVTNPNWCEALSKKIQALEDNGTWILTKLPPGRKAIDSKWVYKLK